MKRLFTSSRTYQTLLNDIAELYTATRAGVVKMYWEIGKRIIEVEQRGDERAAYGGRLLPRLSADLTKRFGVGFSLRNLHRMKALYLQQKQILPVPAKLGWTHQVELLSMPDARLRQQLAQQAERKDLSSQELRALVQEARERQEPRPSTDAPSKPPQLLTPKRGTLGLFQIKDVAGRRCLDLGFEAYRPLTATETRRFHVGHIVRRASDGTLTRAPEATAKELYTYAAEVLRVVDGDTLWMVIHVTDTDWRQEKLRLRGIDCAERGTARGDAATRCVQELVRRATRVVITTTKPDKWDRYLSDIFLTLDTGADDVFLNNRLLELGHAHRYDEVAPEDWEGDR